MNSGQRPSLIQTGVQAERIADTKKGESPALEAVMQTNSNLALASQFPEWDLLPPAQLIRRKSKKLG